MLSITQWEYYFCSENASTKTGEVTRHAANGNWILCRQLYGNTLWAKVEKLNIRG